MGAVRLRWLVKAPLRETSEPSQSKPRPGLKPHRHVARLTPVLSLPTPVLPADARRVVPPVLFFFCCGPPRPSQASWDMSVIL